MTEHSTGNRKDLGSIPNGVEAFLFSQKISSKIKLKNFGQTNYLSDFFLLGTWINFLGFLRDVATSMFWHRNKLQPTLHQSTILELVLKVFVIPFESEQDIIFELRLCRNSSR